MNVLASVKLFCPFKKQRHSECHIHHFTVRESTGHVSLSCLLENRFVYFIRSHYLSEFAEFKCDGAQASCRTRSSIKIY